MCKKREDMFSDINDVGIHFVIGHPIAHSISPLIYNTLYKKYDMNCTCVKADVAPENLKEFLLLDKNFKVAAINLTIPHKSKVIKFLDSVEEFAKVQESVNSVLIVDGAKKGTSTDGMGFSLCLKEHDESMENKNVFIYSAGGAASAIAHQAASENAKEIFVFARKVEKAQALCDGINSFFDVKCRAIGSKDMDECIEISDAFINCSPLGMHGFANDFENLEFLKVLPKTAFVCDIVYNPAQTKLLKYARELGYKCIGGIGMLIWQAIAAFNYFYDLDASSEEKKLIDCALREHGYEF